MERQLQLAHISSPPIGSACRADDRGAWRSVFSLLIGAPSATRTRPCALGLRRSSSTTMAPAARASPLPKAFTYRGQRQPRAFCISRRRVFAPTHPWLAPIIPAKARRAMAATAAARAAAVAAHFHCSTWSRRSRCCMRRAIHIAYHHVGALWQVQFIGANFDAAVNVIGQPTPVWPPRQRQRSTDRERCATRASSSSAAAIRA